MIVRPLSEPHLSGVEIMIKLWSLESLRITCHCQCINIFDRSPRALLVSKLKRLRVLDEMNINLQLYSSDCTLRLSFELGRLLVG
jgi:hypothetical protein